MTTNPPSETPALTQEQEILGVLRRLLTTIVRETTPPPGLRHPLSDQTLQDIRAGLMLIAARERELADAQGRARERPYYADEPKPADVVPLSQIKRPKKD